MVHETLIGGIGLFRELIIDKQYILFKDPHCEFEPIKIRSKWYKLMDNQNYVRYRRRLMECAGPLMGCFIII